MGDERKPRQLSREELGYLIKTFIKLFKANTLSPVHESLIKTREISESFLCGAKLEICCS